MQLSRTGPSEIIDISFQNSFVFMFVRLCVCVCVCAPVCVCVCACVYCACVLTDHLVLLKKHLTSS